MLVVTRSVSEERLYTNLSLLASFPSITSYLIWLSLTGKNDKDSTKQYCKADPSPRNRKRW